MGVSVLVMSDYGLVVSVNGWLSVVTVGNGVFLGGYGMVLGGSGLVMSGSGLVSRGVKNQSIKIQKAHCSSWLHFAS